MSFKSEYYSLRVILFTNFVHIVKRLMEKAEKLSKSFKSGIEKLGFHKDNALFLTDDTKNLSDPEIVFHIETAQFFRANAIYLRKQLIGSYKPQVSFDYSDKRFSEQLEREIADIEKNLEQW